jgi:hypothetical protein
LNKQSRTADKGWSSSLGVRRGANNSSLWKRIFVRRYYRMWYVKLPQSFDITEGVSERDADCYLWIWESSHLQNETEPDGARQPVLFCNPSGRVPRTWQNPRPCVSTPLLRQIYNITADSPL